MSFTIRQASLTDIPQVRDIYNYYVRNTTISLKLHEANDAYIASRLSSTLERELPYFVAVSTSASVSAESKDDKNKDKGENGNGDVILGYAHLSPFSNDKAGYSPAVELTLYLRPDSISGGIGTALMKELTDWVAEREYWAFEGDQAQTLDEKRECGSGSQSGGDSESRNEWVKVKQIYAIMSQDVNGRDGWVSKGEKNRDWYEGKLGFREVGRLPGIGEKFGIR